MHLYLGSLKILTDEKKPLFIETVAISPSTHSRTREHAIASTVGVLSQGHATPASHLV